MVSLTLQVVIAISLMTEFSPSGKGFARGDALMRHRQRGICAGSILAQEEEPDKASSGVVITVK
jgi:hypothetical protein